MKVRLLSSTLTFIVIPSEARDLQFAAKCRSLASLGVTIHERVQRPTQSLFSPSSAATLYASASVG